MMSSVFRQTDRRGQRKNIRGLCKRRYREEESRCRRYYRLAAVIVTFIKKSRERGGRERE
ncbi:hypothetical protein Hanom_Chr14g01270251 [Helianthus anomalus]